jgi:hypothetical protein
MCGQSRSFHARSDFRFAADHLTGDLGRSFRGKATRKCQMAASLIWSEFQARVLRASPDRPDRKLL